MSSLKQIEALHKISEVLAEAFSKVKFISGQYLTSLKKDEPSSKVEKKSKGDPEKTEKSNKTHEQTRGKIQDNNKSKSNEESKDAKEGKLEQKKNKQHEKKQPHPDRPKRPASPFFRFNNQNLNKVKAEYPNLAHTEVVGLISQIWGQLEQKEKQPYENQYKQELKKYQQQMKRFYALHPEERTKKMLKEANREK